MFSPSEAIKDMLTDETNGFDWNDVGTIEANPTIKLIYETLPTSFNANGHIDIGMESLDNIDPLGDRRKEIYSIQLLVSYQGTHAIMRKIVQEIDSVFNYWAENDSDNHVVNLTSYRWISFLNILQIEINMKITKQFVDVT